MAEAQPRVFRECISASLWGAALRPDGPVRTMAVAPGWVPVGGGGVGGGNNAQFAVVLCR